MAKSLPIGKATTNTKSPWHLHGSQIVSIDVETTGLDPMLHEIFQIACVALDYQFKPLKGVKKFVMSMQLDSPETVDYEGIRQAGYSRKRLHLHTQYGLSQQEGVEYFKNWIEDLELAPNRRICPLALNWQFDKPFIQQWLGNKLFGNLFHPHYRDLIPLVQFINDLYYIKGEDPPYRQANLAYLAKTLKVDNLKHHDALNDVIVTAEIYRRLLNKYQMALNLNAFRGGGEEDYGNIVTED